MQTILGSGGIIATELARSLKTYTGHIRLVSRNPKKVNAADELVSADLMDANALNKAVEGSSIVYVTIGFPYSTKTWQELWPKFMRQVVTACKEHHSKLVFFDNIYMYDEDHLNGMTEDTRENPPSKKGKIRMEVVNIIRKEVKTGDLNALIARCADYYGPGVRKNGMLRQTVFEKLAKDKKANWLGSDKFKHSFTYTVDAAKATALLGNTEDAYNQVWHLPTAHDPYTGREWIRNIAQALGKKPRYQVAPKLMVQVLGWFIPIMREMVEMLYQYDRDYVFDSSKFEKRFGFVPTPYSVGIKEIVENDYNLEQG